MENNIKIPTINELTLKWEKHNKQFGGNKNPDVIQFQQIIDLLSYSKNFLNYIYLNEIDNIYLSYIIYASIVHYINECYKKGDIFEIKTILKFVDKKLQDRDESIRTLVQLGVLENLDMYPEILPHILDLMPKYMKSIFMKYYSHYLK